MTQFTKAQVTKFCKRFAHEAAEGGHGGDAEAALGAILGRFARATDPVFAIAMVMEDAKDKLYAEAEDAEALGEIRGMNEWDDEEVVTWYLTRSGHTVV